MTDIIIKKAVFDDAYQIAEVHVSSWKEACKHLMTDRMLSTLSVQKEKKKWDKY